eukprot:TRINITY_DN18549_c0_g1_i2.p1 TRINITY_DN18549_c0_g1~~TRINITY_DN18549_c0_g1_i2.p1  ORF type:complete len:162 (-),score=37.35 TRINITY_DN18549_c0_g1_i2:81-566(-)
MDLRLETRPNQQTLTLEGIFVYYDRDGDGRLTQDEFLQALRGAGVCPTAQAFEKVCSRSGATPDVAAFKAAVQELLPARPTVEAFLENFRCLSQSGRMDVEMMKHVVTSYGDGLTEAEVEELVTIAQPDKDSLVDMRRLGRALLAPPPWLPKVTSAEQQAT